MYRITKHAMERFVERATTLGVKADLKELYRLLKNAKTEKPNRTTKWELFKRQITHGKARILTNRGWRFIVCPRTNTVITVERINPAENYPRGTAR